MKSTLILSQIDGSVGGREKMDKLHEDVAKLLVIHDLPPSSTTENLYNTFSGLLRKNNPMDVYVEIHKYISKEESLHREKSERDFRKLLFLIAAFLRYKLKDTDIQNPVYHHQLGGNIGFYNTADDMYYELMVYQVVFQKLYGNSCPITKFYKNAFITLTTEDEKLRKEYNERMAEEFSKKMANPDKESE